MKFWQGINSLALLLWPLSLLFCLLANLRRGLYRSGLKKSFRSNVPVIVVGNISVGGTGKTPVVIAVVELLSKAGFRPGVVSRGYGGEKQSTPLLVDDATSAAAAGDEPVLIYQRTKAPVCVFPDRSEAVNHLLASASCDVIVTDDGLQHYRLQRDLEIVVVDGSKLHGNGFCLPAGPLREPVSRLKSCDYVLYNRQTGGEEQSFFLQADAFVSVTDGADAEELPMVAFNGKTVNAIAGTASPQRFFTTLQELGINTSQKVFPDHHAFTPADFDSLQGKPLLMTEKDAVKCRSFGLHDTWYLRVSAQLPEGLQTLLLQTVQNWKKT